MALAARATTTRGDAGRAVTRRRRASIARARETTRASDARDGGATAGTMPTGTKVALDDARAACVALALEEADAVGKITLTGPGRGTAAEAHRRVEFRWVTIRGRTALQRTRYDERQAFTSNHAIEGEGGLVSKSASGDEDAIGAREALEEALKAGYKHWRVEHARGGYNVTANAKKARATISRDNASKGTLIDGSARTQTIVVGPQGHDREKSRLLTGEDPFLRYVGVVAKDGTIKASKRDKYKQVEEFLKILNVAYDTATSAGHMKGGDETRPLRVCDLGCGNAYLTFGAYSLLSSKRRVPTNVVGVDVKRQAREHNSRVAKELGWDASMRFIEGTIADADVTFVDGSEEDAFTDVVLALHACDTATDESIVRTVRWCAPLALIAPCCHHDLQVRLKSAPHVAFPPMARHGILSERLGDVLTDAFRAHILRLLGYRVDVMEFVGGEHTPRNTLIRAIRTNASASKAAWEEYDHMCSTWGVTPFLADALAEELAVARRAI
jgi:SAM-dependent methyltransferase